MDPHESTNPDEIIEGAIAEEITAKGEPYRFKQHWMHYRWVILLLGLAATFYLWLGGTDGGFTIAIILGMGAITWLLALWQAALIKITLDDRVLDINIKYLPLIGNLYIKRDPEHQNEILRTIELQGISGAEVFATRWWQQLFRSLDIKLFMPADEKDVVLQFVRSPKAVKRRILRAKKQLEEEHRLVADTKEAVIEEERRQQLEDLPSQLREAVEEGIREGMEPTNSLLRKLLGKKDS